MKKKSYKAYRKSNYLKKEDFPEPGIFTITRWSEELVTAPGKKPELELVLYSKEYAKGLICNQTNGAFLAELTSSEDPSDWIGTVVEAYNEPTVRDIFVVRTAGEVLDASCWAASNMQSNIWEHT
jgi:hypothetical protein